MKKKREIQRIEQALIAAHRRRKEPERADSFTRDVMFQIRQIGRRPCNSTPVAEYRSVRAFAAATCCLALLLFVYAGGADLSAIQYQVVQSVIEDSSDFALAAALAVI